MKLWVGKIIYKNINKDFSVIFIKSNLDKEKNKLRTDISIDILKKNYKL